MNLAESLSAARRGDRHRARRGAVAGRGGHRRRRHCHHRRRRLAVAPRRAARAAGAAHRARRALRPAAPLDRRERLLVEPTGRRDRAGGELSCGGPGVALAWQGWPASTAGNACPLHADRVQCLLAFTRRELTAARTDPATVRELVMAVEADPTTSPDEVWALRDAGRDYYTPALDPAAASCRPTTAWWTCTQAWSPPTAHGCAPPRGSASSCRHPCGRPWRGSAPHPPCATGRATGRFSACSRRFPTGGRSGPGLRSWC
jgi:hypothetical protein